MLIAIGIVAGVFLIFAVMEIKEEKKSDKTMWEVFKEGEGPWK